jgi:hypothetical protein
MVIKFQCPVCVAANIRLSSKNCFIHSCHKAI